MAADQTTLICNPYSLFTGGLFYSASFAGFGFETRAARLALGFSSLAEAGFLAAAVFFFATFFVAARGFLTVSADVCGASFAVSPATAAFGLRGARGFLTGASDASSAFVTAFVATFVPAAAETASGLSLTGLFLSGAEDGAGVCETGLLTTGELASVVTGVFATVEDADA